MDKRTANIVEMFLTNKFTYDEIGKSFNISRQRVEQILKKHVSDEIKDRQKKRRDNFVNNEVGPWIKIHLSEATRKLTIVERILIRCKQVGDCLIWTGSPENTYGQIRVKGKKTSTHRVIFKAFKGRAFRPGKQIDHLCMNKACVNPAHLEEVTPKENIRRYWEWKRTQRKSPREEAVL